MCVDTAFHNEIFLKQVANDNRIIDYDENQLSSSSSSEDGDRRNAFKDIISTALLEVYKPYINVQILLIKHVFTTIQYIQNNEGFTQTVF